MAERSGGGSGGWRAQLNNAMVEWSDSGGASRVAEAQTNQQDHSDDDEKDLSKRVDRQLSVKVDLLTIKGSNRASFNNEEEIAKILRIQYCKEHSEPGFVYFVAIRTDRPCTGSFALSLRCAMRCAYQQQYTTRCACYIITSQKHYPAVHMIDNPLPPSPLGLFPSAFITMVRVYEPQRL